MLSYLPELGPGAGLVTPVDGSLLSPFPLSGCEIGKMMGLVCPPVAVLPVIWVGIGFVCPVFEFCRFSSDWNGMGLI